MRLKKPSSDPLWGGRQELAVDAVNAAGAVMLLLAVLMNNHFRKLALRSAPTQKK